MTETTIVELPVRDAYDRWAESYDAYDNPMVFAAQRILERYRDHFARRDVVEFGCGTGRNLALFEEAGASSSIGLDLSDGMLARAAARGGDFRLLRQDLTHPVPLPDGSADLAVFCLVLEHVGDPATPLSEARRLLRRGGRVIVVEIHPDLANAGIGAHFRDGDQEVRMPTVPHRFSDHLNAFARAGLTVDSCREWCPRDFGDALPAKLTKRGPDRPLTVEFLLSERPSV